MGEYVFGISTEQCKIKPDSYVEIMRTLSSEIQDSFKENLEYIREENPGCTENKLIQVFFEDEWYEPSYDIDSSGTIWAAFAESINEKEFGDKQAWGPFNVRDDLLFVCRQIPKDENDIAYTQKQIVKILSRWLNPFLEHPVDVKWYYLSDEA